MNLFTRTFSRLYASLDRMVGDIENHDALIRAAIDEQRHKIAKARIQLRRLEQSEQHLQEQITQLEQNNLLWRQRALAEAEQNEPQALLCLQRQQQGQQQIARLTQMASHYRSTRERMQRDIGHCEQELSSMTHKHQLLRARQSSADALELIDRQKHGSSEALEQSFDRWEVRISESELVSEGFDTDIDPIEQDYLRQENEQALRQQLAALISEHKHTKGDAS